MTLQATSRGPAQSVPLRRAESMPARMSLALLRHRSATLLRPPASGIARRRLRSATGHGARRRAPHVVAAAAAAVTRWSPATAKPDPEHQRMTPTGLSSMRTFGCESNQKPFGREFLCSGERRPPSRAPSTDDCLRRHHTKKKTHARRRRHFASKANQPECGERNSSSRHNQFEKPRRNAAPPPTLSVTRPSPRSRAAHVEAMSHANAT